jgi:pSer/pThr/pTyr-binding forkhead associated (FHA) protein
VLNSRDVSKYHLRIQFKEKRWLLMDGSKRSTSVNGTWVSLNNKMNRIEKRFSDPVEICNGDQLKISENHITFTFHNFKE